MRKNEAKRGLEAFDGATRWIYSIALATGENRTLVMGKDHETQFLQDKIRGGETGMKLKIEEKLRKLLPEMTTEEYVALKEDIEANGQLMPIIINQDGVILDGQHRREILNELGISDDEIKCEVKETKDFEEMRDVCFGAQQRRNLNPFQRCELVYNLQWPRIQKEAERRETLGTKCTEGTGDARDLAAKKAMVGVHTWDNARKILDTNYEELKKRLRRGELTIKAVANYIQTLEQFPEDKQEPYKEELEIGKPETDIKNILEHTLAAQDSLNDNNELIQAQVKPNYETEFYTPAFDDKRLKRLQHDLLVASGGNVKLKTVYWETTDFATEEEAKEKAQKLVEYS